MAISLYLSKEKRSNSKSDEEEFRLRNSSVMDFSLLSPLEFFVDPKNGDGRNNKPPAMRVRVDCYTKNYLSVYNKVVQAIL